MVSKKNASIAFLILIHHATPSKIQHTLDKIKREDANIIRGMGFSKKNWRKPKEHTQTQSHTHNQWHYILP